MLKTYEREAPEQQRGQSGGYLQSIRGFIAFAQGDLDRALTEIRSGAALDPCDVCYAGALAIVFDRAAQVDSAIVYYENYLNARTLDRLWVDFLFRAQFLERLAQLHDQRGQADKAIAYYARFIELWKNADPELQPRVRAAQQRLSVLNAKRG